MFELAKKNKTLFRAFIGLFVFMELFGTLFFVKPANAQITIVESIPAKTEWGWAQIKTALTTAAMGSLLHASSYFMRKMAYDGATYIASGGKGQGALAFKDGPASYFKKLAKDSSADMINEFGKPFGLNLCSTPDLQLQIFLQIGLHSLYWKDEAGAGGGPSPSCTWQQLDNAWSAEAFEEKYGPGGSKFIAENFTNALRFEDSDFGIALGAKAKIDRNIASAVLGGIQERTEGQGFKPLTSLIEGKVKSPAQVVKEESKVISSNQQGDMTSSQLAGVYGSGFLQVIPMAASVFLNTLVGEGLKRAQKELLNLGKDKGGGGNAFEALTYESSGFQSSRKKAESIFSDLLTVAITQVNSYGQLEEFSSCPDYPVKPGLNNCVMDSGLRQALEESKLDEPLTIAKALEKGYLHGSWPLLSPDRTADNLDRGCYQKGYCYPNIQKLRRARILPLGFEIAVTLADPDDPEANWTLKKVVDGFYDCAEVGDEIVEDLVNHPYCHLIDPNWILKMPEARCNAQVYASNLLDDNKTGVRSQECVDPQSCLKENEDGSCEFFGYCTKEKNVWRFNADKCEPQYNTCTTFVSSEGQVSSYIARTLDYGECSFDSAGCRTYSTERNGDPAMTSTTWVSSSGGVNKSFENLGRNQSVYFNQNIENYTTNCSKDVDGCSEFYPVNEDSYEDPIYLQKAPDYLSCYDTKPTVPFPGPADECKVVGTEGCEAQCTIDVGCQQYCISDNPSEKLKCITDNFCDPDDLSCINHCSVGSCDFACTDNDWIQDNCLDQVCMSDYEQCVVEFDSCLDVLAEGMTPTEWYSSCTSDCLDPNNMSGYAACADECSAHFGECKDLPNCTDEYGTLGSSCFDEQCALQGTDQACVVECEYDTQPKPGAVNQICLGICSGVEDTDYFCGVGSECGLGDLKCKESSCNDNKDNDGDGAVDCLDNDCFGKDSCGDDLGIYVYGNSTEIDWPQTKADLVVLGNRPEVCEDYAQVCLPSEVGCDAYTPVAGPNPVEIPGIVGDNYCDASCANYETFRQGATLFESGEFPLYFIPGEATQCNEVFSGCDEFTNIDELSRGGEALERYTYIKYCERPTDNNEKVFYSWEGSSQEGYVLKLHDLRPITQEDYGYLSSLPLDFGEGVDVDEIFVEGSPAYASDSALSLQSDYDACNQTNYNNLINNVAGDTALTDCRALYDKDGKIYYRLLSDTITVSDECHPLRKTDSDLYVDDNIIDSETCDEKYGVWGDVAEDDPNEGVVCQRCYAGGRYENGSCIYWAMSGADESTACPATAVGCREYSGNWASNLEEVFLLDFEIFDEAGEDAINDAKSGWSPANEVSISSESIQVTKESLKIVGDEVYYEFDNDFVYQDTFELSFWARGESQELKIYFEQEGQDGPDYFTFNKITGEIVEIGVGPEWRQYRVGPVVLSDITSDKIKLVFDSDKLIGSPLYFIDNLKLDRVSDKYYRIKDSWKKAYDSNSGDETIKDVPGVCDETPNDPYPGLALGCRQYEEESTGNTDIYATGFDTMCRDNAIGCRALYDSNNNSQVNTVIYNLWCQDGEKGGDDRKCELMFDPDDEQDKVVLGSCIVDVSAGEVGCFVDGPINGDDNYIIQNVDNDIENSVIKKSTVIIPGDSDSAIFLTDRSDFRCSEKNKGCQEIALEEEVLSNIQDGNIYAYDYIESFVLNDPDHYEETLCRSDLVGCDEFAVDNEKYFFKDPNITGSSLCEYKDEVSIDEITYKGWFLGDYGVCGGGDSEDLCRTGSDCDEGVSCLGQGTIPCYDNYLLAGGEYGMWSNNSIKYGGLVGVCSEDNNGCREFIDPQDTSALYEDGYPYYLIYNQKLINPVSECEGQASLQEGCVLFNKTDYPNLLYNTKATYDASEEKNFEPVSLVSDGEVKDIDSNILLKVVRDRECAEWLSCQGYVEVADTQSEGAKRNVCYAVQSCEAGTALDCSGPVKESLDKDEILDLGLYIKRNISWQEGREYSGFSLYNQYQVGDLGYLRVKNELSNDLKEDEVFIAFIDKENNKACDIPGDSCGDDLLGTCYDQKCVYPPDGAEFLNTDNFYKQLYNQDCRGYPELDSPFMDNNGSIVESWLGMRPLFSNSSYANSNVCQPGEDCSCDYLRVGYGQNGQATEDRFFELDGNIGSNYINGDDESQGLIKDIKIDSLKIIQGGDNDGEYCGGELEACPTGSDATTAIGAVKKNRRIGWKGYCLERDYSHHIDGRIDSADEAFACLTWMPLDFVPGAFDIYNADESIGYVPPVTGGITGGKAYCTEMVGWQNMELYSLNDSLVPSFDPHKFDCDLTDGYDHLDPSLQKSYCLNLSLHNTQYTVKNDADEDEEYNVVTMENVWSVLSPQPSSVGALNLSGTGVSAMFKKYELRLFQELVWAFINTIAGQNVEEEILHHDEMLLSEADINSGEGYFSDDKWIKWGKVENESLVQVYETDLNYYNPGNHFISRVDTGLDPESGKNDTATLNGGQWGALINDVNLKILGRWTVSFMATQGYDGEMVAPLLPDLEKDSMKWLTEYASPKTTKRETLGKEGGDDVPNLDVGEYYDSGVTRHRPNKIESFISKDIVKGVSFVPLWVLENSTGDNIEAVQIPMIGVPLTIDFGVDYESVNGDADNIAKEDLGHSSQSNSKDFGKYWVLETEYKDDDYFGTTKDLEGYILVWMALDPFSGVNEISHNGNQYSKFNIPGWDSRVQNPFSINVSEKYVGGNEKEGNYIIALEVLFDKDSGEFAGYRSRNISTFGGESELGFSMAVVFTLNPMCVEAVEVYDDAPDDSSFVNSKAWTNRLWKDSGYNQLYIKDDIDITPHYMIRDVPALPFGSINSDFNDKWFITLPDYELGDTPHAGRPTLCVDQFYFKDDQDNDLQIHSKCQRAQNPLGYSYTLLVDHFYPGIDGASVGSEILNTSDLLNDKDNIDLAKTTVQKLFAKVFNVRSRLEVKDSELTGRIFFNDEFNDSISPTTSTDDYDEYSYKYKDIALDEGRPPTIFYPAEKFKLGWNYYQDKFAVNGAEKVDNKLYGKGNLNANVSFYAWADHNQMALRRIMVDWREEGLEQSGTISGEAMGYYMNAKPYCDVGLNYECMTDFNANSLDVPFEDVDLEYWEDQNVDFGEEPDDPEELFEGLTCIPKEGDEPNNKTCPSDYSCVLAPMTVAYGNQLNETCRTEPISLVWNYTCDVTDKDKVDYGEDDVEADADHGGLEGKPYVYSVSDIDEIAPAGSATQWKELLTSKGHKNNDLVCVFKPRVQVLDNWGWCTGSCDYDERGGCYNLNDEFSDCEDPDQDNLRFIPYSDIIVVAP